MRRGPDHRPGWLGALLLVTAVALVACTDPEAARQPDPGAGRESAEPPGEQSAPQSPAPQKPAPQSPADAHNAAPGTTPPPWLFTRVLPEAATGFGEIRRTPPALRTRRFTLPDALPPLPGEGFAARITDPAPARVVDRSTWRPGCPVSRDDLAWLRVTFRGFDGGRHTGELLVNGSAAADLRQVFRDLWRARFPLEQMAITPASALDAPPTGDGNNTGAFVCRPVTGGTSFSQHAYGLAVDVNPFQNPYVQGTGTDRVVLPELASAYLDRSRRAPGMVRPGGPVVRAFARIGWEWGGDYRTLKDWQHFSATGG